MNELKAIHFPVDCFVAREHALLCDPDLQAPGTLTQYEIPVVLCPIFVPHSSMTMFKSRGTNSIHPTMSAFGTLFFVTFLPYCGQV